MLPQATFELAQLEMPPPPPPATGAPPVFGARHQLKLFVAVTSVQPPRAYVFDGGVLTLREREAVAQAVAKTTAGKGKEAGGAGAAAVSPPSSSSSFAHWMGSWNAADASGLGADAVARQVGRKGARRLRARAEAAVTNVFRWLSLPGRLGDPHGDLQFSIGEFFEPFLFPFQEPFSFFFGMLESRRRKEKREREEEEKKDRLFEKEKKKNSKTLFSPPFLFQKNQKQPRARPLRSSPSRPSSPPPRAPEMETPKTERRTPRLRRRRPGSSTSSPPPQRGSERTSISCSPLPSSPTPPAATPSWSGPSGAASRCSCAGGSANRRKRPEPATAKEARRAAANRFPLQSRGLPPGTPAPTPTMKTTTRPGRSSRPRSSAGGASTSPARPRRGRCSTKTRRGQRRGRRRGTPRASRPRPRRSPGR